MLSDELDSTDTSVKGTKEKTIDEDLVTAQYKIVFNTCENKNCNLNYWDKNKPQTNELKLNLLKYAINYIF